MKSSVIAFCLLLLVSTAFADYQQPPASDQGPTRKLGRGLSNLAFGVTELPQSFVEVNYKEGNAAMFGYGLTRGLGRMFARMGYGIYEMALFPFPTHDGKYTPPYKSNIPWINSGFGEYPPELGFETRYSYTRSYPTDL
ncbi:MAG: exosortase system-associated protein, TIGR04073 family [Chthoniobacterales bacterium]